MNYGGTEPSGPVARYARGDDYHDVMVEQSETPASWIEQHVGRAVAGKAYVDTGPMLERDLARRAGLGWFGKNTMLINPQRGLVLLSRRAAARSRARARTRRSRPIIAARVAAVSTPVRRVRSSSRSVLDSTKCISYLTIELKGEIPGRAAAEDRRAGLRMRHLPGGVSVEREVRAAAARGRVSRRARRSPARMRGRSRARSSR